MNVALMGRQTADIFIIDKDAVALVLFQSVEDLDANESFSPNIIGIIIYKMLLITSKSYIKI